MYKFLSQTGQAGEIEAISMEWLADERVTDNEVYPIVD